MVWKIEEILQEESMYSMEILLRSVSPTFSTGHGPGANCLPLGARSRLEYAEIYGCIAVKPLRRFGHRVFEPGRAIEQYRPV